MAYLGSSGIRSTGQKYRHLEFFEKDGENCNFNWDESQGIWEGNIYIPEVSTGLYETTNIFIIEQFGEQEISADNNLGVTGEYFPGGWGKPITPVQFEADELGRKDTAVLNGTFEDITGVLPNVKPAKWIIPGGLDFNNRFISADSGIRINTNGTKEVSLSQNITKADTPYSVYIKVTNITGNKLIVSHDGNVIKEISSVGDYYCTFKTSANSITGTFKISNDTNIVTESVEVIDIEYVNVKEIGKWIAYWEDAEETHVRKYDNYFDYNLNSQDIFLYQFDLADERPTLELIEDTLEIKVDYNQNAVFEGLDYYGNPSIGDDQNQPSTGEFGSFKVNDTIDESAIQLNIALNSEVEGVYERILVLAEKDTGHIIGKFKVYGEVIGEDERFTMMIDNLGYNLSPDDQVIFKSSDINEWGPDWELLNTKHKEMLLEGHNIIPFTGAYKGIINAIKFFGYDNVKLKEYWLNIDKESVNYGKYKQTTVIDVFDDAVDYGDTTFTYPNKIHKKTSKFALVYEITRPTGIFDKYDVDQTEETFEFTLDEILIKLFGLKERLKKSFLPLNARIIDIIGEATYFGKIETNAWLDQQRIDKIDTGIHPTFKKTPEANFGYIQDLRTLNDLTRGKGLNIDSWMDCNGYKYEEVKGVGDLSTSAVGISSDLYWWNPVTWDADNDNFNASWLYLTDSSGNLLTYEAGDGLEVLNSFNYSIDEDDYIRIENDNGEYSYLQVGDLGAQLHTLESSTGNINTLLPSHYTLRIGGIPLHGDSFTLTDANGKSRTFTFDHYTYITAGGKIGLDIHHKGTDGTILWNQVLDNENSQERLTVASRIVTAINRQACSYATMQLTVAEEYDNDKNPGSFPGDHESFIIDARPWGGNITTFEFDQEADEVIALGTTYYIPANVLTDQMNYGDSRWMAEGIAKAIQAAIDANDIPDMEVFANDSNVEFMFTVSEPHQFIIDMSGVTSINNFSFKNGALDTDGISSSLGITAHQLNQVYDPISGAYQYGLLLRNDLPGTVGNGISIDMHLTTGIENFIFEYGSDALFSFLSWPNGTGIGIGDPIPNATTVLAESYFPEEPREEFAITALGGISPTRTSATVNKNVIRLNVKYLEEASIFGGADTTHLFFRPTTGSSKEDGTLGGNPFNSGKDQSLLKIEMRKSLELKELNDVLLGYFHEFSPMLEQHAIKDITALPDKCGIPVGYPVLFENTSFLQDWNYAELQWNHAGSINSNVFYDFSVGTGTGTWNTTVDHVGDIFTIQDSISGNFITYTVEVGDDEQDVINALKVAFDAAQSGNNSASADNFAMPWDDYSAESLDTTGNGYKDTIRLRRLSNDGGLSRELWVALTDDRKTSTTTSNPQLQLQISSGTNVNTWNRFGHGNFYEMEWIIDLIDNPDGNEWNYNVRGDLGDFEKLAVVLPYTGKYTVRMRLYNTYNDVSEHVENQILEIGNKQAEFIGFYKFREKEYTWNTKPKNNKLKNITWNKYGSIWDLPIAGDNIMDDYSDKLLNHRGIDSAHASLYESLDRANYILNKETFDKSTDPYTLSENKDVSLSYYYNDGIDPAAVSKLFTPGPYSWDNMNPGNWDDLYHLWWSSAKVSGDTPSSFRITTDFADNSVTRDITIQQQFPEPDIGTHDFLVTTTSMLEAAAELNGSTDPVISKYVWNAVIHDSNNDGVADTEKYILAVAKKFGQNGDWTSITSTNVTISQKALHEINNPTFNDVHFIKEDKNLPKLTFVTFTYDKSEIPGKCEPEWHIINNDSPETDDIYFTGRWFTYLFKREGNYTVDLTLEDTNGNKMTKSRNIVIIK